MHRVTTVLSAKTLQTHHYMFCSIYAWKDARMKTTRFPYIFQHLLKIMHFSFFRIEPVDLELHINQVKVKGQRSMSKFIKYNIKNSHFLI